MHHWTNQCGSPRMVAPSASIVRGGESTKALGQLSGHEYCCNFYTGTYRAVAAMVSAAQRWLCDFSHSGIRGHDTRTVASDTDCSIQHLVAF